MILHLKSGEIWFKSSAMAQITTVKTTGFNILVNIVRTGKPTTYFIMNK